MKVYTGTGNGAASDAVRQALAGVTNPSLIIFAAGYDIFKEAAKEIKARFPDSHSIGVIGTHLTDGKVSEGGVAAAAFGDEARCITGVIEGLSASPAIELPKIKQYLRVLEPGKDNSVCLEYCTNNEGRLVTTMNAALEGAGVHLAGGTAFGAPNGSPSLVARDGEVYEDACVYAFIRSKTGKIRVYKENIYYKDKDTPYHFATKVDTASNALYELDGRPACDVYSEELGIPKDSIIGNVFKNPMGRAIGDDVSISSMRELAPGGGLYNYKQINRVDCIYFLKLGDYKQIGEKTRERILNDCARPSFVFSVDCIYRYLLYKQDGYFDTYAQEMAGLGRHFGTVGGGEQFNNQHVNQTMVCAVFE